MGGQGYCGDVSTSAGNRLFIDPELSWQPVSRALITERRIPAVLVALVGLALVTGALLVGVGSGGGGWALLLPGMVLLLGAGVAFLFVIPRIVGSWRYAEREQDLLVSHGRLLRRLSVVPYGRMQVIDVSSNPISQQLGIATVSLVTASAATDARIPGLPTDVAHDLRDRLAAKGEAAAAGL